MYVVEINDFLFIRDISGYLLALVYFQDLMLGPPSEQNLSWTVLKEQYNPLAVSFNRPATADAKLGLQHGPTSKLEVHSVGTYLYFSIHGFA